MSALAELQTEAIASLVIASDALPRPHAREPFTALRAILLKLDVIDFGSMPA
jgi:hypothetical protein